MDLLFLYLLGNINSIKFMFLCSAIVLFFYSAVRCIFDLDQNTERKVMLSTLRKNLIIVICSLLFSVLLPSRDTLILMASGKLVIEAAKTEEAKSIAGNSAKIIDGILKEYSSKYEDKNGN